MTSRVWATVATQSEAPLSVALLFCLQHTELIMNLHITPLNKNALSVWHY